MRRDLKVKLSEIVVGRDFEVCIVEDVYGGENFDTVRKLLNLNTVPNTYTSMILGYIKTYSRMYST